MASVPPPPPPLPAAPPPVPVERTRRNLRYVAGTQKGAILALLAYLTAVLAYMVTPAPHKLIVSPIGAAAVITAAVFVFMLAIRLYGTATGVILGILTLVPLLGLIVLLVVNGKATSLLKSNGVEVGFLGADLKKI